MQINRMTKIKLTLLRRPRIRDIKFKMRRFYPQLRISVKKGDRGIIKKKLQVIIKNKI